MFENSMLQQCTLLLMIIINISILLQITEHVEYLNQKANPKIVYRSGFDWIVSVAWKKSQFIYMCTISIAPPACVLLQADTREYIQTDVSACTNLNMKKLRVWRLVNATAKTPWSLAHHDKVFSNSWIFPAALPYSTEKEQWESSQYCFYCLSVTLWWVYCTLSSSRL